MLYYDIVCAKIKKNVFVFMTVLYFYYWKNINWITFYIIYRMSSESEETDIEKIYASKSNKKSKHYAHKYRKDWAADPQFKSWIAPSTKRNTYFFCTICNQDYIGGLAAVKKHTNRKKHIEKTRLATNQPSLKTVFPQQSTIESKVKAAELKISAFITEHNLPFSVADHPVQLIKEVGKDPEIVKKLTCNRSKCSSLATM